MSSNGQIFPQINQPLTISAVFVDNSNNTITNWTGAASQIFIDTAEGVAGNAPVEQLNSSASPSGYGTLQLTAAQMNGNLIGVQMSITNPGATLTSISINTDPGLTPGVRPTSILGMLRWLFQYFFGGGNLQRGSGFQTINNDDGSTMTTIFTSGTETEFIKGKSNP